MKKGNSVSELSCAICKEQKENEVDMKEHMNDHFRPYEKHRHTKFHSKLPTPQEAHLAYELNGEGLTTSQLQRLMELSYEQCDLYVRTCMRIAEKNRRGF